MLFVFRWHHRRQYAIPCKSLAKSKPGIVSSVPLVLTCPSRKAYAVRIAGRVLDLPRYMRSASVGVVRFFGNGTGFLVLYRLSAVPLFRNVGTAVGDATSTQIRKFSANFWMCRDISSGTSFE